MNGKLPPRSILKAYPIDRIAIEVILLTLLGAAAIILRAKLRIPLHIPGHHGLEVMALFLIGRKVSKQSFASTISSVGAALFILFPFMGFKDPFLPVIYLLMGLGIDILYRAFSQYRMSLVLFALLGGIAYSIIPLSRIIITLTTGFPYKSLMVSGFAYPLASHFIFGASGAVLAWTMIKWTKKIRNH